MGGLLTTSVLVILASSSDRLSPCSVRSTRSSWRPQTAAPTLPVAIMEGGYIAKLKSGDRERNGAKVRRTFEEAKGGETNGEMQGL